MTNLGNSLPEFLKQEDDGKRFIVQTNDDKYIGSYKIVITAVFEDRYLAWKSTAWFTATMPEQSLSFEIELDILELWVDIPNKYDDSTIAEQPEE